MKTKNYLLIGMIALSGVFAFTSCSDDDDNSSAEEELSTETVDLAQEASTTESIDGEIDASIDEAIAYSEQQGAMEIEEAAAESECATVTVTPDDETFPKTITIDFGDGCDGLSGLTRSGSITIVITDSLRNPGAEYTATFDNYAVEGFAVTGSKSSQNTGTKEASSFTEEMDLTLTTPSGIEIQKQKTITREWIEGMDTYTLVDDVFLLSGSAEVTSTSGRSYSYTITEPLKIARTCENILEGVIEIDWSGQEDPVTIDYGEGMCDWKVYISQGRRIMRRQVYLSSFNENS